MLFKNKEKILATIAGVLFFGMIVNTINSESALNIVQKDSAAYISDEEITEEATEEIEEAVINEKISPKPTVDPKQIAQVKEYLSQRNAPLAKYADTIVSAALEYGIDYRLVAAISVIESEGGKNCFRSYNAWGWGRKSFDSWEDGIYTVTKGLSKYYANGATTPESISVSYCPPNAAHWASNVRYVMNQIAEI